MPHKVAEGCSSVGPCLALPAPGQLHQRWDGLPQLTPQRICPEGCSPEAHQSSEATISDAHAGLCTAGNPMWGSDTVQCHCCASVWPPAGWIIDKSPLFSVSESDINICYACSGLKLAAETQPGSMLFLPNLTPAQSAPMLPTAKQAALWVGVSASARQAMRGSSRASSRNTASDLRGADWAADPPPLLPCGCQPTLLCRAVSEASS